MTLHKITELYKDSICLNIASKFQTTAIFKICVKENNYSNKTCMCVHDLLLYRTSFTK
jgi:hypothetical protein